MKKFFVLLIFATLAVNCWAQSYDFNYEKPQKFNVREITITGVQYLDRSVLLSISGIGVGDTILVPGDEITNAIKKYWDHGLFSDVQISATKIEGKDIYLNIFLQEQVRVSSYNFTGVRNGEVEDLKELIKLRIGGPLTESILDNSIRILKKHYRAKAFLNVDIDVTQTNDTTMSNGVKLTFNVHKNGKVKIGDITFEGNEKFTDRKLRGAFEKIHRRDWNIFKSAKFIEADYEEDHANLIAYYNEYGYRDAKILSDTIYNISPRRIGIKFKLTEGSQYHISDIKWIGNTKIPGDALTQILGIKKGDIYNRTLLDERLFVDDNSITTMYMDDGYLFFNVEPVETKIEDDSVALEMRIYEGNPATINNIFIAGNTKTNEHVIRREIWSKPGYLFSKTEITRTYQQLAQMGHFDPEKIGVNPIPNQTDGTVDIKYQVEEKANDQIQISGGWGNNIFVGTLGVSFSNFSMRRIFDKGAWRPVPSGDSQQLSLRASTNGTYYKSFSLSFVEPWFGGKKPTNLSVSLYYSMQGNSSMYFYQTSDDYFKVTGAAIGLGTRLKWPDDYFTLYGEFSYQNYHLSNWDYFIIRDGYSNNLSFKGTISRNSTDQAIYPRKGSNFSISLQLTPPYSLFKSDVNYSAMSDTKKYRWIEYHKWTGQFQWFIPLVENLVLYSGFRFGYLGYYNENLGYSPFEGFDLGGDGMSGYNMYGRETVGLRGYENSSLTPYTTNSEGNSIGAGHIFDKYTLEVRYPISLKPQAAIYLLAFAEAGNAWENLNEFNPFNVHRSVGVGARFFLPMLGMLGVDWGYGFDPIVGRSDSKSQFHFMIGQQF